MHSALEYNFNVLVGFPVIEGVRRLKLIGLKDQFTKVLNYVGKIADGDVVSAPLTPMKGVRKHVERKKVFYCFFCSNPYYNQIFPHCVSCHFEEDLVKDIMKMPNKTPAKKLAIRVMQLYITKIFITCYISSHQY